MIPLKSGWRNTWQSLIGPMDLRKLWAVQSAFGTVVLVVCGVGVAGAMVGAAAGPAHLGRVRA